MRTAILLIVACFMFISCNKRKYENITNYNDKVVKFVEQSENTMKVWNSPNFTQAYEIKKQNAVTKLLVMQDSLNAIEPLKDDDTMRLAGLAMLDNYLYSFAIYDTIQVILSDSIFFKSDSIHIQELLKTNKNMLKQQAESFIATQKRFSERYELQFLE